MNNIIQDKEISEQGFYELDNLKDHLCISCENDFKYTFRKGRRVRNRDFSYYVLYSNNSRYIVHNECLDDIFMKYCNDNDELVINNNKINKIYLYDRYGDLFTEINYLKKFIHRKHIHDIEQLYLAFIEQIDHLIINDVHDPYKYSNYKFIDNYLDEFMNIKQNFIFNGKHVDQRITPDSILT